MTTTSNKSPCVNNEVVNSELRRVNNTKKAEKSARHLFAPRKALLQILKNKAKTKGYIMQPIGPKFI